MPNRFALLCVPLAVASTALAQPSIRAGSVVNAASYLQTGLPNHGVAQGGMFILKGQGLGARGTTIANAFPLPTVMGGTSMKITVGGVTADVIMVYVVAGQAGDQFGPFDQLAGIVPSTTPAGTGTITVTYDGRTSAPAPITIVPSAFGIFTLNQGGTGPGVFTDPDARVNTLTAAARPGDLLFIWGTGLGPISGNDAAAPPVGNLNVPVEVYVGNQKASVTYQGRSGCCAGLDQILFTVPPGVTGCYVPVVVKIGNTVSNFATLSVAPSGSVCSDPTGFSASELQKAQSGGAMTIADINVARLNFKLSIPGVGTAQGNVDNAEGHFRSYPPGAVLGSPRGSIATLRGFPSAGCVAFPYTLQSGQFFDHFLPGVRDATNQGLDAGPALNVTGPLGARQLSRKDPSGQANFEYEAGDDGVLGGGLPPLFPGQPEYLAPGSYRLDNGSGGPGVGPFSATLTVPASSIAWTNRDAIGAISRSQDLTVTWSGGGSGLVAVTGNSSSAQAGAEFACVGPADAGSLTVPAWVLSALPASAVATDIPVQLGFLALGSTLSSPARFQARGVDAGYFNWGTLQVKNVNYQ